MTFVKALPAADVPEGGVAKAVVNTREIAIIHRGDRYFALDGICTHEAGPLGEGTLEDDELVCPWHAGRYGIETGEANPETNWVTDIKAFPVRLEGGYVWVDL